MCASLSFLHAKKDNHDSQKGDLFKVDQRGGDWDQ